MLLIDYTIFKHTRNCYLYISVLYKQTVISLLTTSRIAADRITTTFIFITFCIGLLIDLNIIESISSTFVIIPVNDTTYTLSYTIFSLLHVHVYSIVNKLNIIFSLCATFPCLHTIWSRRCNCIHRCSCGVNIVIDNAICSFNCQFFCSRRGRIRISYHDCAGIHSC